MGRKIFSEALSKIIIAEKRGFASTQLQPISPTISSFLEIMKQRGYIKNFEVHHTPKLRKIKVELLGRLNDCQGIRNRLLVKANEIEKYRLRTIPPSQCGCVVLVTQNGILDHEEAIRQRVGGRVLGYFY